MEPVICIETLFPDLSFEERLSRIAEHSFRCAEFWSWKDKDLPALARAPRRHHGGTRRPE